MDHTVHTAHMLRGEPRRGSPQTCRFAPRPGLASVWGAGSPQTNKFIRELGKQTGDRTRVLAAPRRAALPLPQSSSGRFHRQWTPGHSEAIQRPFRGRREAAPVEADINIRVDIRFVAAAVRVRACRRRQVEIQQRKSHPAVTRSTPRPRPRGNPAARRAAGPGPGLEVQAQATGLQRRRRPTPLRCRPAALRALSRNPF